MVLLVVDAQRQITNPDLYMFETFCQNVQTLIAAARKGGVEVLYVRHDDGEGQPLSKGREGFEIYGAFAPAEEERIFDKTVNSCFRDTGLLEYLRQKGETEVMAVGLQTDYCMDATIKAGFEHGLHMVVPAYANSTFDNPFMTGEETYRYYNEMMWNRRYAECITMEQALQRMALR